MYSYISGPDVTVWIKRLSPPQFCNENYAVFMRALMWRTLDSRRKLVTKLGRDTALHGGKGLAVSFAHHCAHTLTKESSYPFGIGRFCSHLVSYLRRVLPATIPTTHLYGI